MFIDQNNRCAICLKEGGDVKGSKLYVDHNHENGVVRDLLCAGCNTLVGALENPMKGEAMRYLERHNSSSNNESLRFDDGC